MGMGLLHRAVRGLGMSVRVFWAFWDGESRVFEGGRARVVLLLSYLG